MADDPIRLTDQCEREGDGEGEGRREKGEGRREKGEGSVSVVLPGEALGRRQCGPLMTSWSRRAALIIL